MRAVVSMVMNLVLRGMSNSAHRSGDQNHKNSMQKASRGLSFIRRIGRF